MLRFILLIVTFCVLCTGCAKRHLSYQQAMNEKLGKYSYFSKEKLQPYFLKAGVSYPPKQIALLVFKQSRRLQLYAQQNGQWFFIKTFPVKAASGGPGPKLSEGDRQVPEGVYHISTLNPESHFLMSMKLSYPNDFDREEAKEEHRDHLGNNIFIHGKALSIGCIAIGDEGIEELFPLVAEIGAENVEVIIAPDDFRYKNPIFSAVHPAWLSTLYQKIRVALKRFPLPEK